MYNSLINQSFKNARKENRPALLTYVVAGDNTKKKQDTHTQQMKRT